MSRIACARSVLALAYVFALTQRAYAQTSSQDLQVTKNAVISLSCNGQVAG